MMACSIYYIIVRGSCMTAKPEEQKAARHIEAHAGRARKWQWLYKVLTDNWSSDSDH